MVSRVSNFDWDKIIKKMDFADAQRSLQLLRGKCNEIEVINFNIIIISTIKINIIIIIIITRHYLQNMVVNQLQLIFHHIKRN
jgi:hypothetical protein